MPGMFEEEPELLDDSDPEVSEELHKTMAEMGVQPEDLPEREDADRYQSWLLADDEISYRSPVEEIHIDFLLEEEFASNLKFLEFFVDAAGSSTTEQPKPVPKPDKDCDCDAIRSVTTSAGESDVLVVYRSEGKRVAILIESKIRAGFQRDQAARYKSRGNAGLGSTWDEYWTCLVSPEEYVADLAGFDRRVSIESILAFFRGSSDLRLRFKRRVFEEVLNKFASAGVRNVDPVMTAFRRYYADRATAAFDKTPVIWEQARNAWYDDSWFTFKSDELPSDVAIIHKSKPGFIHMVFRNRTLASLEDVVQRGGESSEVTVVQTGNSVALQVQVDPIKRFEDPASEDHAISSAFDGVNLLLDTWRSGELPELRPYSSRIERGIEDHYSRRLTVLTELLHGLIRARALEYGATPPYAQPGIPKPDASNRSKTWVRIAGMSGGFQIRVAKGNDGEPIIFAESTSRIWNHEMRHIIRDLGIESTPYDYMNEMDIDVWVDSQLKRMENRTEPGCPTSRF